MAIGRPGQPLDFNSIDGQPVSVIILLVSPTEQTGSHIQALATVSRMMTDDNFRTAIRQAESAQAVFKLIEEHEKVHAAK